MTDGRPGTILITGVAGFGGSSLISGLRELGYRVTGLDVTPPSHTSLLQHELEHSNFRYAWRSLQDIQPGDLDEHFVVVHLAAQADTPLAFDSARYMVTQNIDGTAVLLEAVRRADGVERLLYTDSGNEFGRPMSLAIDESHPLTSQNPYGFSKAVELACGRGIVPTASSGACRVGSPAGWVSYARNTGEIYAVPRAGRPGQCSSWRSSYRSSG